ncbi:MAG: GNAT family N-acetyltransferase [bacterium]|nr:GNAT family N-acetyltransferase [bacterium]MDT8396170.1 GNAT family N-acetyltransferase [bacterium]
MLLENYPSKVDLKDGTQLTLRAMTKQDDRALMDFFESLTEEDRLYLRNNVSSYRVVREWFENLNYNRVFPLLALVDGRIVANATLHRKPFGWMRHVGEIRIVVSPEFRKKGLARIMAAEIIANAREAGLEKLTAEMAVSQKDAFEAFHKLGFKDEAKLKGYIRDGKNRGHDLLIMTLDL